MADNIWLRALLLIVAGILSASTLIVSRAPKSKEYIDKIIPAAGIIGIALLVFGILDLFGLTIPYTYWEGFDVLKIVGAIPMGGLEKLTLRLFIILWVPLAIVLGFIQGYSLINKYVFDKAGETGNKAGETFDKVGDKAYEKLAKVSVPFGIAGIVLGILMLIA